MKKDYLVLGLCTRHHFQMEWNRKENNEFKLHCAAHSQGKAEHLHLKWNSKTLSNNLTMQILPIPLHGYGRS